ncbi:unnamed protein product, partial [Allacma fusca]
YRVDTGSTEGHVSGETGHSTTPGVSTNYGGHEKYPIMCHGMYDRTAAIRAAPQSGCNNDHAETNEEQPMEVSRWTFGAWRNMHRMDQSN